MNHKLPVILAIAMAVAALSLYLSDSYFKPAEPVEVRQGTMDEVPDSLRTHTPPVFEFKPRIKEFILEDGTHCVMVWAPQRAQSSGIACDWEHNNLN